MDTIKIVVGEEVIAITFKDHSQWGCPHCGCPDGRTPRFSRTDWSAHWICAKCRRSFVVVPTNASTSDLVFMRADDSVCPVVFTSHPLGDGDIVMAERFRSRGIGVDVELSCFVCGFRPTGQLYMPNLAAFVSSLEAGQRVVKMFDQLNGGARADFHQGDAAQVQVKVGACNEHTGNLDALHTATSDDVISIGRISMCL